MARIHIIGAGMAGLAAALRTSRAGVETVLYDAAGHAGGRCRSFHDATLDRVIDNGNHLLLSGNPAVNAFLAEVGASDALTGPRDTQFPFLDLATGERWTVRINDGLIPWWIACPRRRVAGTRMREYLGGLRLAQADDTATVAQCLDDGGPLYRRFWEPMAVSVLNTPAETGSARLLWNVVRETFGRGGAACRPRIARNGLSESFVDPALATLGRRQVALRLNARLRAVESAETDGVSRLLFTEGAVELAPEDQVVLALPAPVTAALLPAIEAPEACHAIVNAHFRLPAPLTAAEDATFLGLVGGIAHWLFLRGDIASVTVSAADTLAAEPAGTIAERLWPEVAQALSLTVCQPGSLSVSPMPPHRIVKEKRATFAQTVEAVRRRPGAKTYLRNLWLSGDWTDTTLPATIEGALRSGNTAAEAAVQQLQGR